MLAIAAICGTMSGKMERSVNIRLPDDVIARIDALRAARRELPSRQKVVREAVEAYLEQEAAPVARVMAKRKD